MPAVRPTVREDVQGILALISEVFAEYGCVLDTEHEDRHLLSPGPHFRGRGGEFWVVEEERVIRATVAVELHPDAGELKCLYVHKSLRGQGWGRKLSELAMEHARAAGRRRMVLWSDTRFLAAHRLYARLGFRRCGARELHDSNNTREIQYERELD